MRDLRRRALESNKTVSRKARSKQSSRSTSPSSMSHALGPDSARSTPRNMRSRQSSRASSPTGNSHRHSRGASPASSSDELVEDEEGNFTDETKSSMNSTDDLTALLSDLSELGVGPDAANADNVELYRTLAQVADENYLRKQALNQSIEQLLDPKLRNWKHGSHSREMCLVRYCFILTAHAMNSLGKQAEELTELFLKSLNYDGELRETILALRAFDLTVITAQPLVYENAAPALKQAISESGSVTIKAAALGSLGILTMFSDVAEEEILDTMAFVLEIVSSDGTFIEATDEPEVVIAAIECYSVLASLVEDLSEVSEEAAEAMIEQLDSSNFNVQIAAAECIALLFEKSYTPREDGDKFRRTLDPNDPVSGEGSGAALYEGENKLPTLVRRYFAYRRRDMLEAKLHELASGGQRHVPKKYRKGLTGSLNDALGTLRNALHGPHWRPSMLGDSRPAENRSGFMVRAHTPEGNGYFILDTWVLLVRYRALKRPLKNRGFLEHIETNPAVLDVVPVGAITLGDIRDNKRSRSSDRRYRVEAGGKYLPKTRADRSMLEVEGVDYDEA